MSLGQRAKPYSEEVRAGPAPTLLNDAQIATLVQDYLPLVVSQVDRVWLSPRTGLAREDLVSAGCHGLLLAARRFDPGRGSASASSPARRRVRSKPRLRNSKRRWRERKIDDRSNSMNGLYVAAAGAASQLRQLETATTNLANNSTPGF
jgi:DNA-directed RNA polymerase specialized sigma subunit